MANFYCVWVRNFDNNELNTVFHIFVSANNVLYSISNIKSALINIAQKDPIIMSFKIKHVLKPL